MNHQIVASVASVTAHLPPLTGANMSSHDWLLLGLSVFGPILLILLFIFLAEFSQKKPRRYY